MSDSQTAADWLSFHAYYHEDRQRLLLEWLRPTARELVRQGSVRRFFFLRYPLGGPHVRWRLLPVEGTEPGGIVQAIEETWASFLARHPSRAPADPEKVERETRTLLTQDANEKDPLIHPDNTLHRAEFQPETERYGGPGLLPSSLTLFCASSVAALRFLERHGELPASRRLPQALRWLLRQAWGFSSDWSELLDRLDFASRGWGDLFPGLPEKADATYEASASLFSQLVARELDSLSAAAEPEDLAQASRLLAACLKTSEPPVCQRIFDSQLHMTANRLGLRNTDEVFLGRILRRAALDLEASSPEIRESWSLVHPVPAPGPLLEREVDRGLSAWTAE